MTLLADKKLLNLLISGGLTLAFVGFYLRGKERAIEHAYDMVEVIVANRDIPPRVSLEPKYLMTKRIPQRFLEPGAFLVKRFDQDIQKLVGKVTVAPVPAGAQITEALLTIPTPNASGVAPLVPPGKRGYMLRLGNLDVMDMILPGDRIDIMATFTVKNPDGSTSKGTYTILQDVLVLGVGKELRRPNEDVSKKEKSEGLVLTLALDSMEAQRLALAQVESQGDIAVVVRRHGDHEIRPLPGVTPANILG